MHLSQEPPEHPEAGARMPQAPAPAPRSDSRSQGSPGSWLGLLSGRGRLALADTDPGGGRRPHGIASNRRFGRRNKGSRLISKEIAQPAP